MSNQTNQAFVDLARYTARANGELFDAAALLTERARKRDVGNWFGSLFGLLNHVLVGDLFWLNRFKPIFPGSKVLAVPGISPPNLSWREPLCEDFAAMREKRNFTDERIVAWFDECPEDRYDTAFQYTDSAGNVRNALARRAFEFFFVHQIHHRGQAAQILDELGIPNNIADNGAFLEAH